MGLNSGRWGVSKCGAMDCCRIRVLAFIITASSTNLLLIVCTHFASSTVSLSRIESTRAQKAALSSK